MCERGSRLVRGKGDPLVLWVGKDGIHDSISMDRSSFQHV